MFHRSASLNPWLRLPYLSLNRNYLLKAIKASENAEVERVRTVWDCNHGLRMSPHLIKANGRTVREMPPVYSWLKLPGVRFQSVIAALIEFFCDIFGGFTRSVLELEDNELLQIRFCNLTTSILFTECAVQLWFVSKPNFIKWITFAVVKYAYIKVILLL